MGNKLCKKEKTQEEEEEDSSATGNIIKSQKVATEDIYSSRRTQSDTSLDNIFCFCCDDKCKMCNRNGE